MIARRPLRAAHRCYRYFKTKEDVMFYDLPEPSGDSKEMT